MFDDVSCSFVEWAAFARIFTWLKC